MISRLMQYGGVAAKVRAMYGKRLNSADYEKLIRLKSVAEIAAYLKAHPAWSDALKGIQPGVVHRGELEKALQNGIDQEYERIYQFMVRNDKPLMRYLIRHRELQEIFRCFRALLGGNTDNYICKVLPFFRDHSGIRFDQLERCKSFDALLECIKASIYYDPLSKLPREPGQLPDYSVAKAVLTSRYYKELLDLIKKNMSGELKTALAGSVGTQIDLINIETILRIKTSFPNLSPQAFQYLIPHHHRVGPEFLRSMIEAPSPEDAASLYRSSPYFRLFSSHVFTNFEAYQLRFQYDFYRKQVTSPVPSVITPIAYLGLKEIEVGNIINIVECVRYGETPGSANITIIGL